MPIDAELEEEAALDAEVIVGDGAETIYGWYIPACRALAELKGESRFPVKVGRTIRNPLQRIRESGGMAPEMAVLGFVARVDDAGNWERWIHAELGFFALKIETAVGNDWYRTSPEELGSLVSAKLATIEAAQRAKHRAWRSGQASTLAQMAAVALGLAGKRLRYQDLIADNGLSLRARS